MRMISPVVMQLRQTLHLLISGPQALAFLPALVLTAFWIGGEGWLIALALGLPLLIALNGGLAPDARPKETPERLGLEDTLNQYLMQCETRKLRCATYLIAVDSFDELNTHHGFAAADRVEARLMAHLSQILRPKDRLMSQGGGRFAIVLAPVATLDLEAAIQLARRMQRAVEAPIPLDGANLYTTCSIGFVLDRQLPRAFGPAMLDAAQAALNDALHNAPSAIRAYAPGMISPALKQANRVHDIVDALENGAIQPWFQPQIATKTGQISGVEALARWQQGRQTVPPGEFLPLIEENGLMEQLCDVIMTRSLLALTTWDKAGVTVPQVGVNFSTAELRNPKLVDKIGWTLDRFDIAPNRLSIEILESVIASSPDDVVVQNIAKLSRLGCAIDLDDFGTGHASLTALNRFDVNRIKIDRSFISNLDRDPNQQRMVRAIISMANQLGLDSLAEGVETPQEHQFLKRLGCHHIQGFGIARPMPAPRALEWMLEYQQRSPQTAEHTTLRKRMN